MYVVFIGKNFQKFFVKFVCNYHNNISAFPLFKITPSIKSDETRDFLLLRAIFVNHRLLVKFY